MAEVLLNHWGGPRFKAFSAGSHPKGRVHPLTLEILERASLPTAGLRSKSWDEFSGAEAPQLDFVITVCGNAANEQCPLWPGRPVTAHWGVDDPAAAEGSREEQLRAFTRALRELEARIKLLVNLPTDALDSARVQDQLRKIGTHVDLET
jgi:arsenate reductase